MFPDLSEASRIAIDVETCDPNLKQLGPGDRRRDGFVAGLAVGVDGQEWYFPIRHEGGDNLDVEEVLEWARRELGREGQPKVGANLIYDLGWLESEGVEVTGPFYDVQIAEPLLDEHANSYALDTLAQKYLGETKDDTAMYQFLADNYGGKPTRNQQAGRIWKAPGRYVADYAKSDVRLPLQVWDEQMERIQAEDLSEVLDLETRLLPVLHAMRLKGVRVDVERARKVRSTLQTKKEAAQAELNRLAGTEVNVNAPAQIAKAFDAEGLDYPRTAKGNPSFTKDWLLAHPSRIAAAVLEVRKYDKVIGTFIDGHILGYAVGDRLHPQWVQLKNDEGGTVSGRIACRSPNLMQLPSRDPELGPLIRSIFIPEEGEQWLKVDFSQIEYRLAAHYALGPGAEDVRDAYNFDPTMDFHQKTKELIEETTGIHIERGQSKTVTFGLAYGMGRNKLARSLNLDDDAAETLLNGYHEGAPFMQHTFRKAQRVAESRGYIRTLGGRKCRYPLWEPKGFSMDRPLPYEEALEAYGPRIQRANTRKALNNLLQGSSADQIKKSLVDLYESGVAVPNISVHDEVDVSVPLSFDVKQVVTTMQNAYELKVPVIADPEVGPDWGNLEEINV